MLQPRKLLSVILFLTLALLPTFPVLAEQGEVNKSVEDYFKNPDKQNNQDQNTTENKIDETADYSTRVTAWEIIKMIFTTLFVIILIYALLKFINKRNKLTNQHKYLQNLGGTSLGTNRSVQVVKVGNRILVVGVGESIQLLKEIDDDEEIKEILEEHNTGLEQLIQPTDIFNRLLEKYRNPTKGNEPTPFSSILKEQLSDLAKGRKKVLEQLEKKGSNKNE